MYYGLTNKKQIVEFAIAVSDVIGHGSNNNAVEMLVETSAAESLLGTYRDDTVYYAGGSLNQIDKGTFEWLQEKYSNSSIAKRIFKAFNIDLSKVSYQELDYSPLLGMIFARLRYWTVTDPIPLTVAERASYWKSHYNSFDPNAKGSQSKYIKRVESLNVSELIASVRASQ